MKLWTLLLGGLVVWFLHFFGVYGVDEFDLANGDNRVPIIVLTVIALAANVAILMAARRAPVDDTLKGWVLPLARMGAIFSMIAVVWQTLPALL